MYNRIFGKEDFNLVRLKGEEEFIIVGTNDSARTAIKILKRNGKWGKVLDEVGRHETKRLLDEDLKKAESPSNVPCSADYYLSMFADKINEQFDFYFVW